MNKILRIFVILFTLLVSTGCSGNAYAVKSYVDDKLKASGCDYKMGKVEVEDVQSQEDLVSGTSSYEQVWVHFSINREGEFHEARVGSALEKGKPFDRTDVFQTGGIDNVLKTYSRNCTMK